MQFHQFMYDAAKFPCRQLIQLENGQLYGQVRLTPEFAQAALDSNPDRQRYAKPELSEKYILQMSNGGWESTHQGLAFDQMGRMVDGQHRCIVRTEIPSLQDSPWVSITIGLTPAEVAKIDEGAKRTGADASAFGQGKLQPWKLAIPPVIGYLHLRNRFLPIDGYPERFYHDFKERIDYMQGFHTGKYGGSGLLAGFLISSYYVPPDRLERLRLLYRNEVPWAEDYEKSISEFGEDVRKGHDKLKRRSGVESAGAVACIVMRTVRAFADRQPLQSIRDVSLDSPLVYQVPQDMSDWWSSRFNIDGLDELRSRVRSRVRSINKARKSGNDTSS